MHILLYHNFIFFILFDTQELHNICKNGRLVKFCICLHPKILGCTKISLLTLSDFQLQQLNFRYVAKMHLRCSRNKWTNALCKSDLSQNCSGLQPCRRNKWTPINAGKPTSISGVAINLYSTDLSISSPDITQEYCNLITKTFIKIRYQNLSCMC